MKILIRVLLSPLVFLWGVFLLGSFTCIGLLPGFVVYSFWGMISVLVVKLFEIGGTKLKPFEPFLFDKGGEDTKNLLWNHFLGLTIYIWAAFVIVYKYIRTGKVFNGN